MAENALQIATRKLRQSGLASASDICACTDEQIADLESRMHLALPYTYRSFLSSMGEGAGKFLVGTDWTLPQLSGLRAKAEELLKECDLESTVLPATAFVFAMHQGYQFLFFDTVAGNDPPVFLFVEGEHEPQRVFNSFSEWLLQCVNEEIETYRELQKGRRGDFRGHHT
jgi:hypothetical protein